MLLFTGTINTEAVKKVQEKLKMQARGIENYNTEDFEMMILATE